MRGIFLRSKWWGVLGAVLLFSSPPGVARPVPGQGTWESTLSARDLNGDHVADAFYDSVLDLTWLRDANVSGAMDWDTATTWAHDLTVGGVGGWRLPTMIDTGSPGCDLSFSGGTDCGYNVQTKSGATTYSEMAHLWYVTLGNKGYYDQDGNPEQPGWGLTNTGRFKHLTTAIYWSGLETAPDPNFAWNFYADTGFQYTSFKSGASLALAVRSGDIGAVPEPASGRMMLAGLVVLCLIGLGRKSG